MSKPKNTYIPGTICFRLLDEDWSGKDAKQIAQVLCCRKESVYKALHKVKAETGYFVPCIHKDYQTEEARSAKIREIFASVRPYRKKPAQTLHTCSTCGNAPCRGKRRAVCWTNCPGWRPEEESDDDQRTD